MRRFGLLAIVAMALAGSARRAKGAESAGAGPRAGVSGTRAMIEFLEDWERQLGGRNPFADTGKVRQWQERLPRETNAFARVNLLAELGKQLLNLGRLEEALDVVTNVLPAAARTGVALRPADRAFLRQLEGLIWLRLGERQNCVKHHTPDSCLAPIRPAGRHVERRGAEMARGIFLELARRDTNDVTSRWLVNICAMTLGEYPDGVPADLRIGVEVFGTARSVARFTEVGAALGLSYDDVSGGAVVEDFDGDGLLDVAFSGWLVGRQLRLFRNLGNGRFEDRTQAAGLTGISGGLNMIQTDYNNDGRPDLHLLRGAWMGELGRMPDSLLRNNGDGTFADVTEEAGLLSFHPKLSAVWLDVNLDGWLDLFLGCESQAPREKPHPTLLYLSRGNGTFREVGAAAGAAVVGFVRGVSAGDYDNDGRQDLYVSMLAQPNRLLRNETVPGSGEARFRDVSASAGVTEPFSSFPCWFWDHDNDGWLDLFVSGYSPDYGTPSAMTDFVSDRLGRTSNLDRPRVYRNRGDGTFADITREAGMWRVFLCMGANFGDLDNDGFLDFYLGTGAPSFASLVPNEMFRNDRGRRFENVTAAGGFGHLQKGHAIAFGDLNNDGQQEVIANMGGAYPGDGYYNAVFANPGTSNRWVTLRLVGRKANRVAVGARVAVHVTGTSGKAVFHRQVGSGGSFGASSYRQEIGLGAAERIEVVEVRWPGAGVVQRYVGGLEPGRFYELVEGEPNPRELKPGRFGWPTGAGAAGHHH